MSWFRIGLGGTLGGDPPFRSGPGLASPVPVATGRQVSVRSGVPVVRVFLVDAHEVVRRGVAAVLEGDAGIRVVGEAGSVRAALRRAPAARPDLAVVGMGLPDGSGARVCEQLRALVPGLRCLMLDGHPSAEMVQAAAQAGASGYLVKDIPGPALVAAVRAVASGETHFDGGGVGPLSGPGTDGRSDRLALLTYRELAVLRLIGEGLTNREIGERLGLATKTIKNYTTRLLAKLELVNRTQAAVLATQLRKASRDGDPGRPR